MQGGDDIQNLAPVLFQFSKRGPANIERALQIDIDNCPEAGWGKQLCRTKEVSRRAIHNNVDLFEPHQSSEDCLFSLFRLACVGRNRESSAYVLIRPPC